MNKCIKKLFLMASVVFILTGANMHGMWNKICTAANATAAYVCMQAQKVAHVKHPFANFLRTNAILNSSKARPKLKTQCIKTTNKNKVMLGTLAAGGTLATGYVLLQHQDIKFVDDLSKKTHAYALKCRLFYNTSNNYDGAFVLPYFKDGDNLSVILARERYGHARGQWSLFGGGIEPEDKNNVIATATREFYEEAIAEQTLCTDKTKLYNKLDPVHQECKMDAAVIYNKTAIFAVEFEAKDMHQLLQSFNHALELRKQKYKRSPSQENFKYIEIDSVACVRVKDLQDALKHNKTHMQAMVVGNDNQLHQQMIPLRALIIDTLKEFSDKGGFTTLDNEQKSDKKLYIQRK